MKNKIYSRSVTIRDNNMNRWAIEFEVRETGPCTRRNVDTFEEFEECFEVSVHGEGGFCSGQCYDSIAPRTSGQKELLDFWTKYHLCGMASGTRAQEEYLNGEQYKKTLTGSLICFPDTMKISANNLIARLSILCVSSIRYSLNTWLY